DRRSIATTETHEALARERAPREEARQMQNFAATLHHSGLGENADQNGESARQSPPRRGAGVMRFTYASGARPLDGFTIKRGIGVGGFGEVYFATSDAGKEVALKHIQRNLDVELRGVTQCLNLK